MRFIPHPLQEFDGRTVQPGPERILFAREVDFLKLLGQSENGNMGETQFGQLGTGGIELPLSAVDENQVGPAGSCRDLRNPRAFRGFSGNAFGCRGIVG